MNTTFVTTAMTAAIGAPHLSGVRSRLARIGAALWRALEAIGQARAQSHLLEFADRCEALQPELARQLRAACRRGPES